MSEVDAQGAIRVLRNQLAGLLAMADSGHRPPPSEIVPKGGRNPGPVWRVQSGTAAWSVRAIVEPPEEMTWPVCVYLTGPEHFPHDFDAMDTAAARRYAMAIVAACDHADGLAAGVAQLTDHKEQRTS